MTEHSSERVDTAIVGGVLIDGTGGQPAIGDIGIRDGRLVDVGGDLSNRPARRRIDAEGMVVCPGFIDLHTHASAGLRRAEARRRAGPNMVMDGVTTAVVNLDGFGGWPIAGQLRAMQELGTGLNAAALVPHNVVRSRVLGKKAERAATPREIERMRALVREGMEQGAWGLSAGLEYSPGRWSTTDELVELVEEVVPYGGIYTSHQRSEGSTPLWYRPSDGVRQPPTVLDAIKETIEIGERTGARVIATHLKTKSPFWGRSDEIIKLIDDARARNVDIWADQYSYETSGSDGSVVLIPRWAFDGEGSPADQVRRVLADPDRSAVLRTDIDHEIAKRGGAERITIMAHPDASLVGRTLAELAAQRAVSTVEMTVVLQLVGDAATPGGARLRGFSLHEDDVEAFMRKPWTACASDGRIELPGGSPFIHPRRYANFVRRIRRYALDRGTVPLEFAIHSATGLPARILNLPDRGLLRPGYAADVVVFDPERIRDVATFEDPHRYNEGIEHVLVNGAPVVADAEPTSELPGQVLVRPGTAEPRRSEPNAYVASFAKQPGGTRPKGWTPTWRKGRWHVTGSPAVLRQEFTTTGRRVLCLDQAGTVVGDAEVFARVRAWSLRTLFTVALHVSGDQGLECAYTANIRSQQLRISRYSYGQHKELGRFPFTSADGIWVNIVFRREGSELHAKAWTDNEPEPNWMVNVTDYTFNSGSIGIGGLDADSAAEELLSRPVDQDLFYAAS